MTHERDLGDPAVDALLRTHLSEAPPPAVDAAILAAAHRAVEAGPRAHAARVTQASRWWMPLAAAAVIGVVVIGIVPVAPTLTDSPAPNVSDAPAVPASPSTSSGKAETARDRLSANSMTIAPSNAPSVEPAAAGGPARAQGASREARERSSAMTAKTTAAPPAAPQAGAAREFAERDASASLQSKASGAVADLAMPAAPPPTTAQAATPAALPPADAGAIETSRPEATLADQRATQAARTLTADQWIARIRTLRHEARMDEAARALAGFRAAFGDADARLPEDLRAWAKTVR